MKIKVKEISYDELEKIKAYECKPPHRPNPVLKKLINILANTTLKKTNFKKEYIGMEKLGKKSHASF